ncbi:MAG: hypothetical protein WAM30_13480, partial [Candidatus Dormiibacterota bacterium]
MKRFKMLLATSGLLAASSVVILAGGGSGAAAASTLPTLTLTLNGKSVTVGGQMVSGAVNVQTTETGKDGAATLVHLNAGVDPSVFGRVVQLINQHHGDINYLSPYGQIVYDADAPHGTTTAQTVLPAGNYIALNGNTNGVPPHAAFTVTPSSAPAALPTAGATENSIDFDFTGPTTLHTGEVVRFVNQGFVVHMDVWVKVKNMSAAKKVVKLLLTNAPQKKAAGLLTGQGTFAGPMSTGGIVQTTITATPGIYVQACFMA